MSKCGTKSEQKNGTLVGVGCSSEDPCEKRGGVCSAPDNCLLKKNRKSKEGKKSANPEIRKSAKKNANPQIRKKNRKPANPKIRKKTVNPQTRKCNVYLWCCLWDVILETSSETPARTER